MVELPAGFVLPSEVIRDGQIFHMAMAVPDLDRAMDQLSQGLNLAWTAVRASVAAPLGRQAEPIRSRLGRRKIWVVWAWHGSCRSPALVVMPVALGQYCATVIRMQMYD